MSSQNAREEALRRMSYILRKHPVLTDKTITLVSFPDDETCGFLVGGNSVLFQRMVNKNLKKFLLERGARVKIRPVEAIDTRPAPEEVLTV